MNVYDYLNQNQDKFILFDITWQQGGLFKWRSRNTYLYFLRSWWSPAFFPQPLSRPNPNSQSTKWSLAEIAWSIGRLIRQHTKYYFATSTGEIYLKFDLERSGTTTNKNRELIIYVYEKKTASDTGTLVTAATINFTTAEYTTQLKCYNLDTNKFYYFRFFNNSNSNPASSMDISGSIIIDDTYV